MYSDVIQASGLTKTFRIGFWRRSVEAVRGMSFTVRSGEIFGLLGPNGAGKTTLIKMLLGFIRPDSGTAAVLGEPCGSRGARTRLGYLPENPALYEYLRGDELLVYLARLAGHGRRDAQRLAIDLLARVGLAGRGADRPVRKFSKGMVQRLALAQALIGDPPLVILDEPMSGLDPIGRKDVRDLILKLRDEGRTICFSSHVLSDAEALCDRVGLIVGGRMQDCGALHELLSPGVRSVELVVKGGGAALKEKLARAATRTSVRDERLVCAYADEASAQEAARAAIVEGAMVESLTPHRETLEDLFVRRAQGQ